MQRRMYPVDVISMCSADGKIYPLRFQIESDKTNRVRIHIDQIISSHESHCVGAETRIFWCRATKQQKTCFFELHYVYRSHSWFLAVDGTLRQ